MIETRAVIVSCRQHPHYGRRGTIQIDNGKVSAITLAGVDLVRVEFTDGEHPTAAFAARTEFAYLKDATNAR